MVKDLCFYLLLIGFSTSSPRTVCVVTNAVYSTSLSKHTVLNASRLVTQAPLSSKCSSTSGNSRQQVHSIARGIATHFVQEHHEVFPKPLGETRLATIAVALFTDTATPEAIWFEVIRYYNVTITCHTTLCHYRTSFPNQTHHYDVKPHNNMMTATLMFH